MTDAGDDREPGMLSPYRVIDLADEMGILAGKILADLGADVVAVEPPGGNAVRRMGPFHEGCPGVERSLVWWAYAAGKRSVTLDLSKSDGRGLLMQMAANADFLMESYPPGYLDGLGLGHEALHEVNPGLVMVSMTPFGQDGPYAGYLGSDLVGMAVGGFANLTGDRDRPPVRVSEPQFGRHAGASGAAAAMIALSYRALTGQGQHVDVSGQEAVARTLSHAPAFWSLAGTNLHRQGTYRESAGGRRSRVTWPCKGGHVNLSLGAGPLGAGTNALMRWMDDEGFADDYVRSVDWSELDFATITQELLDRVAVFVDRFFMEHTKEELYDGAVARRILLFPVSRPSDIVAAPQLEARGFFTEMDLPAGSGVAAFPGGFIRSSETIVGPKRRAPTLGEHNAEILVGELGVTDEGLVALRQGGVI